MSSIFVSDKIGIKKHSVTQQPNSCKPVFQMQKEITNFIKENRIATICCIDDNNKPYCFHCFYAFDEKNHLLIFKSSSGSSHSQFLAENRNISGSILPEKPEFLAMKGIQLTGTILYKDLQGQINPAVYYHKKFPLALAKSGNVWCVELERVKMTDNTTIFGKKLNWTKEKIPQEQTL